MRQRGSSEGREQRDRQTGTKETETERTRGGRRWPTPANKGPARRSSRQKPEVGGDHGPDVRGFGAHLVRFTPMAKLRSQR